MIHEAVLGAVLVGVLGLAGWMQPSFLNPATQLELSTHAVELGVLAIPMTLIIVTGGIDLSVGAMMAICAVVLGLLYEQGVSMWVAGAAALTTGSLAGLLNGVFVAYVRVHPLIVTLATLAAYRGLAEGISLGRPISGFPPAFLNLGDGTLLGVPIPLIVLMGCLLAAAIATRRTVQGMWVYAIGAGERQAEYAGVPTARVKLALYGLCGLAAGLASILVVARRNTAKADVGSEIELEVITAVVLGGTSIFGGRGTLTGTVLGVLVIHEVRELVSWQWQDQQLILIVIGAILIGSVLLNNLLSRRRP